MILLVAKNGKPVVVHLNTDALAALNVFRSRGDGSGLVVLNAAGEALNVKRALVPVVRAAKIPDFRRHDVPPHVRVALASKGCFNRRRRAIARAFPKDGPRHDVALCQKVVEKS